MPAYSAANPPDFSTDPAGFVKYYYGSEYLNPDGTYNKGIAFTTGTGGNAPSITAYKQTPETHPWLYIKPGEVDIDSRIYGADPDVYRTPQGGLIVPRVGEEQRQASYDQNNYF